MFTLKNTTLNLNDVTANVAHKSRGGLVTFSGMVRDVEADSKTHNVTHLNYAAHESMALTQMKLLGEEVKNKWPGVEISAQHRLGRVLVGEIAIVVAVAGKHRREAFEACAHFMDRLKQDVPIWKMPD